MDIFFSLNLKYLRFGMDVTNLSKWEKGKHAPKLEDVVKIAAFFDVKIDDLLLTDMSNTKNGVEERNEKYYSINEKNALDILELNRRVDMIEKELIKLKS